MRNISRIFLLPLLALLNLALAASALPQTAAKLGLTAKWDNGAALAGTVALSQPVLGAPDVVLATKTFGLAGHVSLALPLAPNSLYSVTITLSTGATLGPFVFTTVGVDLAHLQAMTDTVVFRVADNSLASQKFSVTMAY